MNRAEAKEELNQGLAIKHTSFMDGEYVYKKDGKLFDETDLELNEEIFWIHRSNDFWNQNWQIVFIDKKL